MKLSVCLLCIFKNERHILYEFINHYLNEGIDCLILIDDNSDDNYIELHKEWLNNLIQLKKVIIKKMTCTGKTKQQREYNLHLEHIKKFDWVYVCDMDEFTFSIPANSTLKSILNNEGLSKYDYIRIQWKIFKHESYYQPKSVINDNLYTHSTKIDPTTKGGWKYFAKTNKISNLGIHSCDFHSVNKKIPETWKNNNHITLYSHNNYIHINHYRTQSEEYLRGVKEIRGAVTGHDSYRTFDKHKQNVYDKKCELLAIKRKNLIKECLKMNQIKPKLYTESSFFLEKGSLINTWNKDLYKDLPKIKMVKCTNCNKYGHKQRHCATHNLCKICRNPACEAEYGNIKLT